MSAKFKRYVLATLGSAVLMGLLALPAEAKPPASNPNAGPPVKQGTVTNTADQCTACHDDTDLISGKHAQWSLTRHATGEAFLRGTSGSCAGCHSGGAFVERVLAGLPPDGAEGDPNPSRQDCRACHQIHTTYTTADWALETTAAVSLYAVSGVPEFNKGSGNLCASCHQPRREYPGDPDGDGQVTGISEHWGPHHGPQSAMMLGVAGSITGSPASHYTGTSDYDLTDSCVSCHMGPNDMHNLDPDTSVCENCHGADFNPSTYQDYIQDRLDKLGKWLVDNDYLSSNDVDGHPTVTSAPADAAAALFNWLYISHEDKSLGVHNPGYTEALLDASCSGIGISCN